MRSLEPGRLRASYLRFWIAGNYSSKFINNPLIIQSAFTLPAHDKTSDALRAIGGLIASRRDSKKILKSIIAAATE